MKRLKVSVDKLITPSAYAKEKRISPAAVSKQMDAGKVEVVEIKGGRLIHL